ncbi:MAG: NAD(P)/FAD-dependent oxidoreductase [Alphaproteobacteria bacterium]|nr:NAD(P)/FAD-dependent oxidoreductase [Alphaproteobacteria bacterium]
MTDDEKILIAGAGPVGYTVALNLAHYGIPFTLFEAGDEIFEDPRAGTIHPPTLEMFETLGLAAAMVERGYRVDHFHYRDRREGLVADFDLGVLADETPYPYRLMLEQHKISRLIDARLGESDDRRLLRNHRVTKVSQDDAGVRAEVMTPSGIETFTGQYLIGCDGGRSQVRRSMNVDFKGITYKERFLVVTTPFDFTGAGYALTNYISDPEEWCALFKLPGADENGIWRALFPTEPDDPEDAIFDDRAIEARLQGLHAKPEPYELAHRNLYEVHQRVATCYREGRILLAGDAAHVNNPLGGMGMNFGIHDAFNLTEKLAAICLEGADDGLLDLYDRQRRTVATEYLQRQTIENKRNIEQRDPAKRKAFHDELRAIAADREKLHAYLRRTAMIEGVERAAAIT